MKADERVIKSYVWHDEDCFFVSTINRDSSAMGEYGQRYAETIVWHFDWEKNERLNIAGHGESCGEGSIRGHMITCDRLRQTGSPYAPEEE